MTIKQKTISGLKWSFADNIANQIIQFVVGIILARLLSPKEFGLIGMLTIFVAISQSLIDSGFSQALIRKQDCSREDYSTVFFFNITVAICLYLLLFFCSRFIGIFYNEPILSLLIKVVGFSLVINSLSVVQRAILSKNINFKLQTKISIISSCTSGAIAIWMAFSGWGVWSLVWKTIVQNFMNSTLLWIWNGWRPVLIFNRNSFREMFGFGSKLMVSGLINTAFINIYYLVIGKYYSAVDLGFYTRADQFRKLPSQSIDTVIQRVSYPVLASIQNDPIRLKRGYKNLIKNVMFITFILMIGMAAASESLVITLIGEQWRPVIPLLQLLCFGGMLYPLQALNLNMLNVKGRSDLFLKLEVIKKILVIPTIIIGVFWGIKIMIAGMIFNSIIAYFINSYWSGKMINYPITEQLTDLVPSFSIASVMGICIWLVGFLLSSQHPELELAIQIFLGGLIVVSIGHIFKYEAYIEIRQILFNSLISLKKS